ncbi:MAG: hypothetical protein U1G07_08950 [Verrucomicrobiota bacterium]
MLDLESHEFREPRLDARDLEQEQEVRAQSPPRDLSPSDAAKWKREYLKGVDRDAESLPLPEQSLFDFLITVDDIINSNETDGHIPLLPPVKVDIDAKREPPRSSKEYLQKAISDYLHYRAVSRDEIEDCRSGVRLSQLCLLRRARFDEHGHDSESLKRIRYRPVTSGGETQLSDPQNIFRLAGEYWQIRFMNGKTVCVQNRLGLRYIHFLIQHQGESHSVVALGQAIAKTCPTDNPELEALGGSGESPQPVVDEATRKQVLETIDLLEKEKETLVSDERLNDIDAELQKYRSYLERATGHQGKIRSFRTPRDSERVKITRAINRAIEAIRQDLPAAADHLKTHIRTGNQCAYTGKDSWSL